MPKIEFIKMNNEAAVTICLGLSALNKNKIGLKKIPHLFQRLLKQTPKHPQL